eukprot:CAMPEP_0172495668 /NCGR_PEP_ID=MMETSP1066-20121228/74250_1 /TAXON_ID=671091 /ORGANISM="Coscinodiscus wailesii, Strain CCMP2513" /LENGTH=371 /DNA_ID=CAMNT_0013267491 /DNA_START=109 /DNA_END=1224 /DNA_ORIENTATION=+
MADATAAFFAKKKKGKKKSKSFNANRIDVSSVISTVHVDAPQVNKTTSILPTAIPSISSTTAPISESKRPDEATDDEWASTPAIPTSKSVVVTQKNTVTELLDMTALEERRRGEDDIQERMRVAHTKRALAKAREGMKNEAARLKDEEKMKEEKEKEKAAKAAASTVMSGGGKWVPPHMRNTMTPGRLGRGPVKIGNNVDTNDESAFPDLAVANDIIEKQKQEEMRIANLSKKGEKAAVWGGGYRPGGGFINSKKDKIKDVPKPPPPPPQSDKSKLPSAPAVKPNVPPPTTVPPETKPTPSSSSFPKPISAPAPPPAVTTKAAEPIPPTPPPAVAPQPAASQEAPKPTTTSATKTIKKKKKKKDISTFKKS